MTVTFDGASAGAVTVSVNARLALPTEFVAVSVNENVPPAVRAPVTVPVAAFSTRPGGSAPAVSAQVIGAVPEAWKVCDSFAPMVVAARLDEVVIDGGTLPASA